MDIKQLEQYLMQSDLGIDAKQLERFLSECDLDDKGFPPEELVSYIRRQIYDFKRLMAYYRCAIMEIETKFNVINEDFSYQYERNPIESIKSRLKEPTSIRDKLARRGLAFSAASIEENLFDVAGVRVVCSFVDDVYRIAANSARVALPPGSRMPSPLPPRMPVPVAQVMASSANGEILSASLNAETSPRALTSQPR